MSTVKDSIVEGNKLIDNFYYKDNPNLKSHYVKEGKPNPYNDSWAWLMPVLIKIGEYKYPDEYNDYAYPRTFGMKDIESNYMVRINRHQVFYDEELITATWLAVVDFIQWYNKQFPSPNKPTT